MAEQRPAIVHIVAKPQPAVGLVGGAMLSNRVDILNAATGEPIPQIRNATVRIEPFQVLVVDLEVHLGAIDVTAVANYTDVCSHCGCRNAHKEGREHA